MLGLWPPPAVFFIPGCLVAVIVRLSVCIDRVPGPVLVLCVPCFHSRLPLLALY